jgi:hypothetical protein
VGVAVGSLQLAAAPMQLQTTAQSGLKYLFVQSSCKVVDPLTPLTKTSSAFWHPLLLNMLQALFFAASVCRLLLVGLTVPVKRTTMAMSTTIARTIIIITFIGSSTPFKKSL